MRNVCTFKWNDPLYPLLGNYFTNGITLLPNRIKHSWIVECDHFVLYLPFWYQSIPNHLDVTHCSQGYVGTYVVNSFLSTDEISFLARACLPRLFRAKRKKKCHAKKMHNRTANIQQSSLLSMWFIFRSIDLRAFVFYSSATKKNKKKNTLQFDCETKKLRSDCRIVNASFSFSFTILWIFSIYCAHRDKLSFFSYVIRVKRERNLYILHDIFWFWAFFIVVFVGVGRAAVLSRWINMNMNLLTFAFCIQS